MSLAILTIALGSTGTGGRARERQYGAGPQTERRMSPEEFDTGGWIERLVRALAALARAQEPAAFLSPPYGPWRSATCSWSPRGGTGFV